MNNRHDVLILSVAAGLMCASLLCAQESPIVTAACDHAKQIADLKKDSEVLRKEIRKVRSSVSRVAEDGKSLKAIPRAIAELNAKIEEQIANLTAFSGEIYRIGSVQDDRSNKAGTNRGVIESVIKDLKAIEQKIKDIEGEIRILRAVQSDLQILPADDVQDTPDDRRWRRIINWRYWGPVGCGISLIVLVIAL